jgi:C4-dicarboxylate transporter, DctQ subunit
MRKVLVTLGIWLDGAEKFLVVVLCGGIVVLVFSGALSRYVFSYSMAWSEELARLLFLWGALFGAAAACRYGQHGGIPLMVDKLPPWLQRVVEAVVFAGMLGFLGYLAWQSWETTTRALASGQINMTTKIPIWVVNAGMFAAFCLAILRTVQGFLQGAYRVDRPNLE